MEKIRLLERRSCCIIDANNPIRLLDGGYTSGIITTDGQVYDTDGFVGFVDKNYHHDWWLWDYYDQFYYDKQGKLVIVPV